MKLFSILIAVVGIALAAHAQDVELNNELEAISQVAEDEV